MWICYKGWHGNNCVEKQRQHLLTCKCASSSQIHWRISMYQGEKVSFFCIVLMVFSEQTWTTALLPLTSSTCPLRFVPLGRVRLTISANLGNYKESKPAMTCSCTLATPHLRWYFPAKERPTQAQQSLWLRLFSSWNRLCLLSQSTQGTPDDKNFQKQAQNLCYDAPFMSSRHKDKKRSIEQLVANNSVGFLREHVNRTPKTIATLLLIAPSLCPGWPAVHLHPKLSCRLWVTRNGKGQPVSNQVNVSDYWYTISTYWF